jgi:hypothetical protein
LRTHYGQARRSLRSILFAELVTRTRLNAIEYILRKPATLAATITHYIEGTAPEVLPGTRRIFFGHTHVPLSEYEYRGILFENTGCAVRGLDWAPKWFEYQEVAN